MLWSLLLLAAGIRFDVKPTGIALDPPGPGALRADSNATGQTSEVNSGQTYDVSAYMKTLAPAKTRGGEVQVYDTANNAVTLPLLFTNDLNGWTKASARITLPAQTRVVVLGFDAGGASFLLDENGYFSP